MTEIVVTEYGRPASAALAAAVSRAKVGDPLAPVTVIVPSNFAGLVARRLLGGGELGVGGVANVHFLTPFRLAELLAVGALRGKRPLTNPVLGAAVRRALADDPRHFRRVRDHQATEQAIAAAVGELSNVSPDGLAAIVEAGGSAASMIELYRAVVAHLGAFHNEAQVARAAAHRPDLGDMLASFGAVIWYLPGQISAPLAGLVGAVVDRASTTVIAGASGVPDADAELHRAARIAGVGLGDQGFGVASEPLASRVVSVTDADEEVRSVLRQVISLVEAGERLDRIGIFYPVPDPYVRIIEHQLEATGIVGNGPSRRRLADSVAGRVLLGALALPGERWRRDRVMALVSSGPIRHGDGHARTVVWERVSREAGVVGDLGDWRAKLAAHRAWADDRRAEADTHEHDRRAARYQAEAEATTGLGDFVDGLAESIAAVSAASSWGDRSNRAKALLNDLLGPAHRHGSWPESEQVAFEAVEAALDRLAGLDEIEPSPTLSVFQRALDAELSVSRQRNGRFGQGVVYGPLSSAPGHDLDAVFVLGCAEGLLPAARREDALIPDAARRLTRGDLPERLGRLEEQHRHFLAALASAPPEQRWLLFPRGDLRSNRRNRPSRWLLPSATALAGTTLHATDFDDATPDGVTEVESHAGALRHGDHHASLVERDLGALLRFVEDDGELLDHPVARHGPRRGIEMQLARRSDRFTEFDGNLSGLPVPRADDQLLSASRLETWAKCGFRYFLSYVLDLDDRDDPERIVELSALDRGSAIHEVLELFFRAVVDQGAPSPGDPWTDEQRELARTVAGQVFDQLEARGRTGRSIDWHVLSTDLYSMLDEFLDADDDHRRVEEVVPDRFELAFGLDDRPPLEIRLDDERRLRFRGMIDRIDLAAGDRAVISDYKTGRGATYRKLDQADDPTQGGTLLQLGLYAEATRAALDVDIVDTAYWMIDPRAKYRRFGYAWTPDRRERLIQVLTTIAEGIEAGVFAATPGEWDSFRDTHENCTYCSFDPVCPRDRAEHADDKAASPSLEVRRHLDIDYVAAAPPVTP